VNAGFSGEIDLLSIDINGNDYWIWDALTCIEPRVVIIETVIEFELNNIVVIYDAAYHYPPKKNPHYFSASPVAIKKLAEKRGYRLVGCMYYGFNTIYIRKDICKDLIPEIPVEQVLNHPRNADRMKLFDEIKNWEYIRV
jgi:hypothetical protein